MPVPATTLYVANAQNVFSEAATARTATGNTAGTDILPEGCSAAMLSVNVTAVSGTSPTLTVQFQQQDANGVWVTLGATSSLNSVTTAVVVMIPPTVFVAGGGVYRIRWVIGGTTPSFTVQFSVQVR